MYGKSLLHGAGLGLRRAHLGPLMASPIPTPIDFMEVAPENWLGAGGRLGHAFRAIAAKVPLVCHGLLLNLGGLDPIDVTHVLEIKAFLDRHDIRLYGDHLAFCGDEGLLYELLPMPMTEDAVMHVAQRIRQVQDLLERRIAVENASYYCAPLQEMAEIEFIRAVLDEADCDLLLDVNNVYVNSQNHGYDPRAFLQRIPAERIAYAHVAGHLRTDTGLIIDTHGAPVIDPVWELLEFAYATLGVFPTLLERDENIPALPDVLAEVAEIARLQHAARGATARRIAASR
ncbi:MAG: DUF692 domain-containing protein [Gammaproteobacteria bacterium]